MSSRQQRLIVCVLRGGNSSGGAGAPSRSATLTSSSSVVGGVGGGGGRRFFGSGPLVVADAAAATTAAGTAPAVKPGVVGDAALFNDAKKETTTMTSTSITRRRNFSCSSASSMMTMPPSSSSPKGRCDRNAVGHRLILILPRRDHHDEGGRHRRIRRRHYRGGACREGGAGRPTSSHQNSSFSSSTGGGDGGDGVENDDSSSTVTVEECAGDLSRLIEETANARVRDSLASELARDLSPSARREVSDAIARRRIGSSFEGGGSSPAREGTDDGDDRDEKERRRSSSSSSGAGGSSKSKEEGERVRTAFAPSPPLPIPSAADEGGGDEDDEAKADDDDGDVPEPSYEDLRLVAVTSSVPFVGFGFMDNFILILAGEAIDVSLGVALGISTMCAAAIGNIVSDVAGVLLGTAIEDVVARMGLPVPDITEGQRKLRSVRFANQLGIAAGLVVGCVLGMCPLLWIDTRSLERRKKKSEIDGIFRSVVTAETRDLVGAEHVSLFFVSGMCDESEDGGADCRLDGAGTGAGCGDLDGRYLWAKYTDRVEGDDGRVRGDDERVLRVPLDRKSIKRRVVMTGEAVNLVDAREDPDYDTLISVLGDATRSMMIVPVFNAHGEVIAVIQAMNKVRKRNNNKKKRSDGPGDVEDDEEEGQGFTSRDMQVLQALASHLSVYLGGTDAEDGIVSFGDSIRRLKDHGVRRSSSRRPDSPITRDDDIREHHATSDDDASLLVEDSPRGR